LHNLKDSNPVQVAEYSVAHQIDEQPAFAWWVPFTLKKKNRILASIRTRATKCNNKFGIKIPTSIQRALEIDRETNTKFLGNGH
jgi:hypothetical protein